MDNREHPFVDPQGHPLVPEPFENSSPADNYSADSANTEHVKQIVDQAIIAHLAKIKPEHQASEQEESNRLQRKAISVQKWLCFFTALAFAAAAYYGYVAKGQKETMDKTYGEIQQQTAYAGSGAQGTIASAAAAASGARAAILAATAAQRASDTSGKQLEMSERPWMYATLSAISPLVFGSDGARMDVSLALRNQGNSPAVRAEYSVKLIPSFVWHPDPRQEMIELCKSVTNGSNLPHNRIYLHTWFPGEQPPIVVSTVAPQRSINEALFETPNFWGPSLTNKLGMIQLFLVACIAYHSDFMANNYRTALIVDVQTKDSSGVIPANGNIALDQIRLRIDPVTNFVAN